MADIKPHGDAANVDIWSGANVYIGARSAAIPGLGEEFGADWRWLGILDGGAGFDGARDSDQKDHFGWGFGIVAQTDKNYKETRSATALENNPVVRALKNPGSTFVETETSVTGTIRKPVKEKFKIAFETINGTLVERYVTLAHAMLEGWAKDAKNEEDIDATEFTFVIVANPAGELYAYQRFNTAGGSLADAGWLDVASLPMNTSSEPVVTP